MGEMPHAVLSEELGERMKGRRLRSADAVVTSAVSVLSRTRARLPTGVTETISSRM